MAPSTTGFGGHAVGAAGETEEGDHRDQDHSDQFFTGVGGADDDLELFQRGLAHPLQGAALIAALEAQDGTEQSSRPRSCRTRWWSSSKRSPEVRSRVSTPMAWKFFQQWHGQDGHVFQFAGEFGIGHGAEVVIGAGRNDQGSVEVEDFVHRLADQADQAHAGVEYRGVGDRFDLDPAFCFEFRC